MKKLRSLFAAVALVAVGSTLLLIPSIAHADAKASKTERRGSMQNQMEMMAKYLELTDAQMAKIKPIMAQSQQRMKKVREDKSLSPEQKRSKMKTIREDSWKKINPILTDAQRKKIAAMRQQRRQNPGSKGKR